MVILSRMAGRNGVEGDLRVADVKTFLTIVRSGSISGAARGLKVTPSQASKAVSRLEGHLHTRLLTRGARGVAVSAAGKRLVPQFEDLLARLRSLEANAEEPWPELTVVGSAFLNTLFVPTIVARHPGLRIRSLEVPPGIASAYATEHSFDVALTTDGERWPDSWSKLRVGSLRKALYGSPAAVRRLSQPPVKPAELRHATFIAPIYSYHGQLVPGDDGCPLHYGERRVGHQTQTVALALEVAARTEQVVFAAALAARPFVESGALVEIAVEGWDVRAPLYLACDAERVRARVQKEIVAALREALVE
jgi:DNA-binding transcriptional LysR family regulator